MNIYPVGGLIEERYEVVSQPMMGGMGIVYFCLDTKENGRPVALKAIRPEFLPDHKARQRFLREGEAWIKLGSHPNIVRCYGITYPKDKIESFLSLELIAANREYKDASLRTWLNSNRIISEEHALSITLQIVNGMEYACTVIPNLVHRDIKPENILVGADRIQGWGVNRVRVTDFGLATTIVDQFITSEMFRDNYDQLQSKKRQLTHGPIGTPLYMAPEQWNQDTLTISTDVYALGCILLEMLTGQLAASGKNITEIRNAHCNGAVQSNLDKTSKFLRDFIYRCVALKPEERFQKWDEVKSALVDTYKYTIKKDIPSTLFNFNMVTSSQDTHEIGLAYNSIGQSYLNLRMYDKAHDFFVRALGIARDCGTKPLECAALGNLAATSNDRGDFQSAIKYSEQLMQISRTLSAVGEEGNAFTELGVAYKGIKEYEKAIENLEMAIKLSQQIDFQPSIGVSLTNLGYVYLEMGELERGIGHLTQALDISRLINYPKMQMNCLGALGKAYMGLHEYNTAIENFIEYFNVSFTIGWHDDVEGIHIELGKAYLYTGQEEKATKCFEDYLASEHAVKDIHKECTALTYLGDAYQRSRHYKQAIDCFKQSLANSHDLEDKYIESASLTRLGVCYTAIGENSQAISCFNKALNISCELDSKRDKVNVLNSLGGVYQNMKEYQTAIQYFEKALTESGEDQESSAVTLSNWGLVYLDMEDYHLAVECYENALDKFRSIGLTSTSYTNQVLTNLGNAYSQLGDYNRATKHYEESRDISRAIGDKWGEALSTLNMAKLCYLQADPLYSARIAKHAAKLFTEIGQLDYAQTAAELAEENAKDLQMASSKFGEIETFDELQKTVERFPFMTRDYFITIIAKTINENVPIHLKPKHKEHLAWLQKIAAM